MGFATKYAIQLNAILTMEIVASAQMRMEILVIATNLQMRHEIMNECRCIVILTIMPEAVTFAIQNKLA